MDPIIQIQTESYAFILEYLILTLAFLGYQVK